MMDDCNHSKVKLLNDLKSIEKYLDVYASVHADNAGHPACSSMYEEIREDLQGHIGKLRNAVSGLAQEGKF
jgi:hypothetical protein